MNETSRTTIVELAEGNPGALGVLTTGTAKFGPDFIELTKSSGLKGSAIWVLYSDECGRDIRKMLNVLRARCRCIVCKIGFIFKSIETDPIYATAGRFGI